MGNHSIYNRGCNTLTRNHKKFDLAVAVYPKRSTVVCEPLLCRHLTWSLQPPEHAPPTATSTNPGRIEIIHTTVTYNSI